MEQGCLACAVRLLFRLGNTFGVFPFRRSCTHSAKNVTFSVKVSYLLVLYDFLIGGIFIIYVCNFILHIDHNVDQIILIIQYLQVYPVIQAVYYCIFYFVVNSHVQQEYDGLNTLFTNAKLKFGVNVLFTKDSEEKLYNRTVHLVMCLIIYDSTIIFLLLYQVFINNFTLEILYNLIFQYISFNVLVTRCIIVSSHNFLYTLLFLEIHAIASNYIEPYRKLPSIFTDQLPLMVHLKQVYNTEYTQQLNERQEIGKVDLTKSFCNLRRLYSAVYFNFKYFNYYYNPDLLIITVVFIVFVILNFYIMCVILIDELSNELLFSRFIINIGVASVSFLIIYTATVVENTPIKISSMLSTFPLTSLTYEEAAQLEFYIRLLREQSPVLVASGAFTANTTMVGPVVSTTITYLIILLQFRS